MKETKTIEERIDEELEKELSDISMMQTGSEQKAQAIKHFTEMYSNRTEAAKLKEGQRSGLADRAIQIGSKLLEIGAYAGLFVLGLKFEETGALSSMFVKGHANRLGRMK